MFTVRHKTRRGGSAIHKLRTGADVMEVIERCHRNRLECTAENSLGYPIGWVWKNEGRWTWSVDREELGITD